MSVCDQPSSRRCAGLRCVNLLERGQVGAAFSQRAVDQVCGAGEVDWLDVQWARRGEDHQAHAVTVELDLEVQALPDENRFRVQEHCQRTAWGASSAHAYPVGRT